MIKIITSKDNNKIKNACSLKLSKYRKEKKEFLAEGKNSLELALKAGVVKEIFTIKQLDDVKDDIVQYVVKEDLLKKIAFSQNPEGIVFVCNMQEKKLKKFSKVVYLDKIGDPGNMGTIIRTALAFNYDAVIVSEGCVDIYNEKVVAASKGAIFLLPIFKGDLKDYKENSTIVVSALTDNSISPNEVKIDKPLVLVIGSESHGVSKETLSLADYVTKIKINNIDSLNASIAAGILMYEFNKH